MALHQHRQRVSLRRVLTAIGPEIDPGVPALAVEGSPVRLALKSGNFGAIDFYEKAAMILRSGPP